MRCLARDGGEEGGGGARRDFESKFNLVATLGCSLQNSYMQAIIL